MNSINKNELYRTVESLRTSLLSNGAKYPFDIFDICSKFSNLEIGICPFKTVGLRGIATLSDNTSDINCIVVNSKLSYEEQNFHGIHELLHIYTCEPGSGQTFQCYDTVKPFQNSYKEWLANEGAAELILSYKDLLPLIKDNYQYLIKDLGTSDFCVKIAEQFSVTSTVIQNRLNSLSYEIKQYLDDVPLENIEIISKSEQKRKNIFVPSLNELEDERLSKIFYFTSKK